MNDHDLLICIDTKLKDLKEHFENHLSEHKKYMYFAFTTTIGLIITLILVLIK